MDRRDFFKAAGAGSAWAVLPVAATKGRQGAGEPGDRAIWIRLLQRIADPVLNHLASGTLKARMPVEQAAGANRGPVTHLEALGRLLAGLAPWIELPADQTPEGRLRAPRALRDSLDPVTRRRLVAALESTRGIVPGFNNWLLFSAIVEAGLSRLDASWDRLRVDYALREHEQWYKGDGVYGDGPDFHWDYYNSFVIQPMLLDVLDTVRDESQAWKDIAVRVESRAKRYAAVQERLIAPDGSFPAVGRSLAYRCGAFHLLAQTALRRALPEGVSPAQVRGALTAVIRRTLEAPGTFDADGWMQIGFCGHQPGVGETYISTGSLYLASVAFLPLGLPAEDPFWAAPAQPWTSVRAWSGQAFPIDHAV